MGARFYAPQVGRFTQKDPLKDFLSDPQPQAPYIYCKDNPIRYIDPNGYETVPPGWTIEEYYQSPDFRLQNEAIAYGQSIARKYSKEVYDKFKHCTVSCEVAKKYGDKMADSIGKLHEVHWPNHFIMHYQDSMGDIAANRQGIQFAHQPGTCHNLCKCKYGLTYPKH
jgi:hypothetical protein